MALSDDVDDPGVAKERGEVALPRNVLWGGPDRREPGACRKALTTPVCDRRLLATRPPR